jgi:predicted phosphodiesterase
MRLLILSDLHLETASFQPAAAASDFDAIVLAGDITTPGKHLPGWAFTQSLFGMTKPIVAVAGNHEFYGCVIQAQRELMQRSCVAGVHFLDPGEVLLDEGRLRVLGCTLWTDFKLPVLTSHGPVSDQVTAMEEASRYVADYQAIRFDGVNSLRRRLTPADTLAFHETERAWLFARLAEPFVGSTVVVTHHAPAAQSVVSSRNKDWLTTAFVIDLPDPFFDTPTVWIHGHTHASFDYRRGNTRIICNPRGYRRKDGSFENPNFAPHLIIDTEMVWPRK